MLAAGTIQGRQHAEYATPDMICLMVIATRNSTAQHDVTQVDWLQIQFEICSIPEPAVQNLTKR